MPVNIEEKIKSVIRDVKDFPKPGIVFKDITPIMQNAVLSNEIVDYLYETYKDKGLNAVAGIESRGFLFGYPLAMKLGVPFVLIRKKGKLPYDKIEFAYKLEYGEAVIEIHKDAIDVGDNVLIHDDLLATGGSATAAAELIQELGGKIYGFNFIVSLDFLEGEGKLMEYSDNIINLARY